MQTSEKTKIVVNAKTIYMDEYSNLQKNSFLFCYKITINNESKDKIKLLNRHWIIIDSNSKKTEVKGAGVLGLQPEIESQKNHEYYSFCNLETNFGTMEGFYEIQKIKSKETFWIEIPRFYLADNLNEFERPKFRRGSIVKDTKNNLRGLITDYDMYFINDEEIYNKSKDQAAKNAPWYYILVDGTNAISYVAQENLIQDEDYKAIEHPLVDFFFDNFNGKSYIRNENTWEQLKRA